MTAAKKKSSVTCSKSKTLKIDYAGKDDKCVGEVNFHYHMYGVDMGTLNVTNDAGEVVWSLSGNQGNSWQAVTVDMHSPSFAFEYTCGSSWRGDAAVALVSVATLAVVETRAVVTRSLMMVLPARRAQSIRMARGRGSRARRREARR